MTTTRAVFRERIGDVLGRRYYVASTTTGTSTVNEIVDSTRTEYAAEWDGATIYVSSVTAPKTALVRGTSVGRIFLDTDLGSAPANGSAIEMVKGFTFDDLNDAIDYGHQASYPYLWLPVTDKTTVTETTGTDEYTLPEAWRVIHEVRRQQVGTSSPVEYSTLRLGIDYELFWGTAGLVYRALNTTATGTKLWFIGEGYATIGASDASTSIANLEIVKHGALYWLYDKGVNPDEAALKESFQKEAEKEMALWDDAKRRFGIPRITKQRVRRPAIAVYNDGTTVPH